MNNFFEDVRLVFIGPATDVQCFPGQRQGMYHIRVENQSPCNSYGMVVLSVIALQLGYYQLIIPHPQNIPRFHVDNLVSKFPVQSKQLL